MNFLSLDLEYNQPTNTIIQVGYVIGDLNSGEILTKKQINIFTEETINPFITQLCNIKQEDVDNGVLLEYAYEVMKNDFKEYNCFRNPITWGGGDSKDLRASLDLNDEMFLFGRRWIDCKTLFISRCFARGEKHQSGLAKSLTRVGLTFEGRKHTAADDALNTFRMYKFLIDEMR